MKIIVALVAFYIVKYGLPMFVSATVASDPNPGGIHHYNGTPGNWTYVGGPGSMFAVTDDTLYGLSPDRSSVWEYTETGWTQIGGPANVIVA